MKKKILETQTGTSGTPDTTYTVKPQLLSVTPSCLQTQNHLGDSDITKFGCQHAASRSQLVYADTVETLPKRLHIIELVS